MYQLNSVDTRDFNLSVHEKWDFTLFEMFHLQIVLKLTCCTHLPATFDKIQHKNNEFRDTNDARHTTNHSKNFNLFTVRVEICVYCLQITNSFRWFYWKENIFKVLFWAADFKNLWITNCVKVSSLLGIENKCFFRMQTAIFNFWE